MLNPNDTELKSFFQLRSMELDVEMPYDPLRGSRHFSFPTSPHSCRFWNFAGASHLGQRGGEQYAEHVEKLIANDDLVSYDSFVNGPLEARFLEQVLKPLRFSSLTSG